MPEGPEVKTIALSIKEDILNENLLEIVWDGNGVYGKKEIENYKSLKKNLPSKVIDVKCRGKKIIICLECGYFLVSFLGMEGHWLWNPHSFKHVNLWLNFGKRVGRFKVIEKTLFFEDTRHFGTLKIASSKEELDEIFKNTGPDWLKGEVSLESFINVIKSPKLKKKELCGFLLEQKYFSGIGNYLRSEILYCSQIKPDRTLDSLVGNEIKILYENCISIINEAYEKGGLTIATYWDPHGNKGVFETKVYNKKVDPFGNKVIKERFKDGRTVHWVKEVQI